MNNDGINSIVRFILVHVDTDISRVPMAEHGLLDPKFYLSSALLHNPKQLSKVVVPIDTTHQWQTSVPVTVCPHQHLDLSGFFKMGLSIDLHNCNCVFCTG